MTFIQPNTALQRAQAAALKAEATEHGLRLDAYLVPTIAEWMLTEDERGPFLDPAEAVFVAMHLSWDWMKIRISRRAVPSRNRQGSCG